MDLFEHITRKIQNEPRLRSVPPAVIEDVLRHGIGWLVDWVPAETHAADLSAIDFEACEGCGHLIDFAEPEGAIHDAEGIPLCNACAVEALPEPPARGNGEETPPGDEQGDTKGAKP